MFDMCVYVYTAICQNNMSDSIRFAFNLSSFIVSAVEWFVVECGKLN